MPVNMAECNASVDKTACHDQVCDYREYASDQHSLVNESCSWRGVCRLPHHQKSSGLQYVYCQSHGFSFLEC